jgi:hypothetical protein
MALYMKVTVVTAESVYVLEQYGSSTELAVRDCVTSEMTGMYNVIEFAEPRVGESWTFRTPQGEEVVTSTVHGARVDRYSPHTNTWCSEEELDKYAGLGVLV